jgi:drug/metabolite transporter (DMT)-like permease
MSNKAIRTKAEELLGYGMSKQQVFDNLMLEFPEARPKKLAEVLRYRPTLWSRERFRNVHLALLALIAAAALLRIAGPLLQDGVRMDMATAYLSLVPIATLLLGYTLYRWQGEVFEWVGWGNVLGAFGLMGAVRRVVSDGEEPWDLLMKLLSVAIGVIALYLARKVFAKPQEVKDVMGQAPPRYVFPEEGMV